MRQSRNRINKLHCQTKLTQKMASSELNTFLTQFEVAESISEVKKEVPCTVFPEIAREVRENGVFRHICRVRTS